MSILDANIGQFVNPVGGGIGEDGIKRVEKGGIVILVRYKEHFIKKNMIIWCKIRLLINPLSWQENNNFYFVILLQIVQI